MTARYAAMPNLRYDIGNSCQSLVLSNSVLECFAKYRQVDAKNTEAGGQLFAKLSQSEIYVQIATEPKPTDKRSRFAFFSARWTRQREIKKFHNLGLHYIGSWHTHPEQQPTPSKIDLDTMADSFRRSKHSLNYFVMAIVGIDSSVSGLSITIHDGKNYHELTPVD